MIKATITITAESIEADSAEIKLEFDPPETTQGEGTVVGHLAGRALLALANAFAEQQEEGQRV